MSDSPHSERHKKRVVQKGLQKLKKKAGWDVEAFVNRADPEEKLRDFDQQLRDHKVYEESVRCGGCESLREDSGDETALCEKHLAAAMGFDG